MNRSLLETVVRHAGALAAGTGEAAPDAELLRRFAAFKDETAFAELVRRHGPMVWSVCRQMLPHSADAEDAFQATFLALVRSAASVRTAVLGNWLHGVAVRAAVKVKRTAARRKQREARVATGEADRPVPDSAWGDLMEAVHDEVRRLPEALRTAFVLCDLEGVRQPDAAARLGWKLGTLTGRLTKARQALLERLTARGIAPSAAAGAVGVGAATAGAVVPSELSAKLVAWATAGSGSVPPAVWELVREVTPMTVNRTKLIAAAALVAGGLGIGVGSALMPTAAAQGAPGGVGGFGQPGGGGPGLAPGFGQPPGGGGPGAAGGFPGGPQPGGPPGVGGPPGAGPQPPGMMQGGRGGGASSGMSSGGMSSGRAWEYKFETVQSAEEFRRMITQRGDEGWEFAGSAEFTSSGGGGRGGQQPIRTSVELAFKRPRAPMGFGGMSSFGGGGDMGFGQRGGGGGFGGGSDAGTRGGGGAGGTGAGPGGNPGIFGSGGGSGGGIAPPETLINNNFKRLLDESGGKDTINLTKLPPETRDRYNQMAKTAGVEPLPANGTMSSKQFTDWYTKFMDGQRKNRPTGGRGGPGGGTGGPPMGAGAGFPGPGGFPGGGFGVPGGLPGAGGGPPGAAGELNTYALKHASAATVAKLLSSVFSDSGTFKAVADARTNTLILTASEAEAVKVKRLLEILDGPGVDGRKP